MPCYLEAADVDRHSWVGQPDVSKLVSRYHLPGDGPLWHLDTIPALPQTICVQDIFQLLRTGLRFVVDIDTEDVSCEAVLCDHHDYEP